MEIIGRITPRQDSLEENRRRGEPKLRQKLDELVGDNAVYDEQFVKLFDSKNKDFARRLFKIFLEKRGGRDSLEKEQVVNLILETVQLKDEEKLRLLFNICDCNGDGRLNHIEVRTLIKENMMENGLKFEDEDLTKLTDVFIEGADLNDNKQIEFEELRNFLYSKPGLVESMLRSFDRWLLLQAGKYSVPEEKDGPMIYHPRYLRNNLSSVMAFILWVGINVGLFIWRFLAFWHIHPYVSVARGAGMCLNFNSSLIMVFILRRTITLLREWRLADYIPLDKNIKYHKYCGFTNLFYGLLHTVAHILNFNRMAKGDHGYLLKLLFGLNPEFFTFCGGAASMTGWICLGALLIIFFSSLPFVRKTGHFEIFYYFHLFYTVYWLALLLHSPNFWIWLLIPGTLFVVERIVHVKRMMGAAGHTYLVRGRVLPSGVTHIVIRRPPDFIYHPGDWLFIQIPMIASAEWHPFTISSAPEMPDHIFLHIRAAGGWTSRLRKIFEEQEALGLEAQEQSLLEDVPGRSNANRPSLITHQLNSSVTLDITPEPPSPGADSGGVYSPLSTSENYKRRRVQPVNDNSQDLARRLAAVCDACSSKKSRIIEIPKPIGRFFDDDQSQFYPREITINRGDIEEGEGMELSPMSGGKLNDSGHDDAYEIISRNFAIQAQFPIEVKLDGPYGSPSSHIFNTEHAVLISTGIGVTPFASILQSIMFRWVKAQQTCPFCEKCWLEKIPPNVMKLRKVEFVWLNREAKCFEWFVHLLSQLEITQSELQKDRNANNDRFLEIHIYITSSKEASDIRSVGLALALDLMHKKEDRDLITGLKTRTKPGRPDWTKLFREINERKKGKVSVFYCGAPVLGKTLQKECNEIGFSFHKENF